MKIHVLTDRQDERQMMTEKEKHTNLTAMTRVIRGSENEVSNK